MVSGCTLRVMLLLKSLVRSPMVKTSSGRSRIKVLSAPLITRMPVSTSATMYLQTTINDLNANNRTDMIKLKTTPFSNCQIRGNGAFDSNGRSHQMQISQGYPLGDKRIIHRIAIYPTRLVLIYTFILGSWNDLLTLSEQKLRVGLHFPEQESPLHYPHACAKSSLICF